MPLESDKRTRVDKIRKTPLEPISSAGFFAPSLFFDAATRRCPPSTQRPHHFEDVAGASGYYCAGSLRRVYSFCRSSHDAGSKSTVPTGIW